MILTASAGMGKTRLARHSLSILEGTHTAWLGATRAAADIPFGAVAALLPEEIPDGGPVELIRETARRVRAWGGRYRAVIAVDDAHLLDRASSTLIAHLISDRLVFAVLTMRAGEPLADVFARLGAEGRALRLELPPLPDDVIDRLIDHELRLAAHPSGDLVRAVGTTHSNPANGQPLVQDQRKRVELDLSRRRRLHRVAQGNPLALRELLHGAEPCGLTELITSRLDGLSPGTRRVVDLVACGEPLAMSILEEVAGLDSLSEAEDSGLIVVERSGLRAEARLDHPLYGEILRSRMPLSRAVRTYRDLAGASLNGPLRRRGDVLLAAVWQVEAGVIGRPDLVRDGAWMAIGHADLELAERLARAARDAEPCDEADTVLAEILAYRGRVGEAARVLPEVPPPDPDDRAGWAVTRAEMLYLATGDIDGALSVLDSVGGDPLAEASRSWLLFFDGQCRRSADVAASVLAREDSSPKARIWAWAAATGSAGFLGRLDEAASAHRRGRALAEAHVDTVPWGVVEMDSAMCFAHLACGHPAAGRSIAASGYEAAISGGGAAMMSSGWALYGGVAALARGHLDEAERSLLEATAGFVANDSFRMAHCCMSAHAATLALKGDQQAGAMMNRAQTLDHPAYRVLAPLVESWRAWIAYAAGDLATAVAAAKRAGGLARESGMPVVEALALYDVARLGAKPDLARLDELLTPPADPPSRIPLPTRPTGLPSHGTSPASPTDSKARSPVDNDLARVIAAAARALGSRDGGPALQAAASQFAERGYDLHAAELFATAAHRHQRHGRLGHADLARAKAAKLRGTLAGAKTLLLQPAELTVALTAREREVVLLAAEHTSAEIAHKLSLALPTVNNNLARAYTKLGITGRAQLRTLLGDEGS